MQDYILEKNRYLEFRRRTMKSTMPFIVLCFAVGLLLVFIEMRHFGEDAYLILLLTAMFVLVTASSTLLVIALLEKRSYQRYRLRIDSESVTLCRGEGIRRSILKQDIYEIVEHSDGTIIIKSKANAAIAIPPYIEDRSNLRIKLHSFGTIKPQSRGSAFNNVITYICIPIFLLFLFVHHPGWSIVLGISLLLMLLYHVIATMLNKDSTTTIKIVLVSMLLLFGFLIIRRMVLVNAL